MALGDPCAHGGTPLTCFYCLHPAMGSFFNAGHQCNPQGWQCPSCFHVYSPAVASCWICPQQPVNATGANPGSFQEPVITCGACRHSAPSMREIAWSQQDFRWQCTDLAACRKRRQEPGDDPA